VRADRRLLRIVGAMRLRTTLVRGAKEIGQGPFVGDGAKQTTTISRPKHQRQTAPSAAIQNI